MIRASPCDFYLRFLLTHPDGFGDDKIRTLVKLQGLDFAGLSYLADLRRRTTPPTPFCPDDPSHAPSQRFITRERIYGLYFPDEDTRLAARLLDHPRGKELVEGVLAAGAAPVWACSVLRRVQFQATPRAVELYRHYFFNTELVNSTELQAFLSARAILDPMPGDEDATRYREAYRRVAKANAAASAPSSATAPFTNILNMIRLGLNPSGVEVSRIASVARMAAIVRSAEAALGGRAERARDFALTGKILTELIESVGDASADMHRNLAGMLLATDPSPVQSIASLTMGDVLDGTPSTHDVVEVSSESPAP